MEGRLQPELLLQDATKNLGPNIESTLPKPLLLEFIRNLPPQFLFVAFACVESAN
jgi:hypothetical protein